MTNALPGKHIYIPVSGTWGRGRNFALDSWFMPDSDFDRYMTHLGYLRFAPADGFWTGALAGLLWQRIAPWIDAREAWKEAADELGHYLYTNAGALRIAGGVTIVAHSHGGQVTSLALAREAFDLPIHVVTIDMPVRIGRWTEMDREYEVALQAASSWTHAHSERGWGSRMRWLGNRLGTRSMPTPARNVEITGHHSGILNNHHHMLQMEALLCRT